MAEIVSQLVSFVQGLWGVFTLALQLSPDVMRRVAQDPTTGRAVLAVVLMGGISQLLGQSVVLFVNKVTPTRFMLSLLIGGVLFFVNILIWATVIWLTGTFLFPTQPTLETTIRLVGLGHAPYTFGVFGLIPYLGTGILRLISVWSFLIVLGAIHISFGVTFAAALVCVGVGWILITVLSNTIGRPIVALREWLMVRVTGTPLEARVQDILTNFNAPRSGGQP